MEQAVIFGKYEHLLGIQNIPEYSTEQRQKIAVILMTPGMLHNVGPFRMYVDIARQLEKQGIPSLRFDLSGIGESLGVGSAGKSIDRAATEATAAMDFMSDQQGIQQFILFGLCSGADDSVQAALNDTRVKGVISLDGIGYKTTRYKINKLVLTLRKLAHFNKVKDKLFSVLKKDLPPVSLASGGDVREFPENPNQASRQFQELVDRGTQLHFIYTGGSGYYNYAQQFYDMLPKVNWKNKESTTYFPHMDHVVMLCEDRLELVNHISDKTTKMIEMLS